MTDSRWEDRARAAKAARLARVIEQVLAQDPSLSVDDVAAAPEEFWSRVEAIAQISHPASPRTRAVVLGILAERARQMS